MRTSAPTDKPDFDLHVLVHSVKFLTNHGIKMAQTSVHVHGCLLQMKNKCNIFFSVDPDMSQNKTEILYNNVLYALVQFSVVLKVET